MDKQRAANAVLAGIIVAVVVAGSAGCGGSGGGETEDETAATGTAPAATPDPVQTFDRFAAGLPASDTLDAATIAEGMRALAGAVGTLGVAPPELLVDLRVVPEHVLLNPASPEVAATVRQTLVSVGGALAMAPGADGAAVQQAAEKIQGDMPLTGQGAALRTFFQEAAKAIGAAAQKSP